MDRDLQLCKLLFQSPLQPDNADAAVIVLQKLLVALSGVPEDLPKTCEQLARELSQGIVGITNTKLSFLKYFSGRGPIANKVADQEAFSRYLFSMNGHSNEQIDASLAPLIRLFSRFNYQPTNNPVVLGNLQQLISHMKRQLSTLPFNPLLPRLPDKQGGFNPNVPTGFYYNGPEPREDNPKHYAVVLHTSPENGVETMLLIVASLENYLLAFRHPLEQVWCTHDAGWTLPETYDVLQNELVRAVEAVSEYTMNFNPKKELAALRQKALAIFTEYGKYIPVNVTGADSWFVKLSETNFQLEVTAEAEVKKVVMTFYYDQTRQDKMVIRILDPRLFSVVEIDKLEEILARALVRSANNDLDAIAAMAKQTKETQQQGE